MSGVDHIPWPPMGRSLIAILRGIQPHEVEGVVTALIEEGIDAIEIPLNSPDPFRSIATAVKLAAPGVLIGAGTVLTPAEVDRLADVGGRLVVSPNIAPDVVRRAAALGLVTMPGVFTPTEALTAIAAGASGLKFFPASLLGPAGISAIRAVLPPGQPIGAVGGVTDKDFPAYAAAGVHIFGLGASLYKPGDDAGAVRAKAKLTVTAYDAIFKERSARL